MSRNVLIRVTALPGVAAFRLIVVALAFSVLRAAAFRSTIEEVGTIKVRFALRVLARYVGNDRWLTEYWEKATYEPWYPWINCHLPLRGIELAIWAAGYQASVSNDA
jgi:hypothetical protein